MNNTEMNGYEFGESIKDCIIDNDLFCEYIDDIIDNDLYIENDEEGEYLTSNRYGITDEESLKVAQDVLKDDEINKEYQIYKKNFKTIEDKIQFINDLINYIGDLSMDIVENRIYDINVFQYKLDLLDREDNI